jgi:hypothetical protein
MLNVGDDLESSATPAIYLDDGELAAADDQRLQFGAQLRSWRPKDEFDPEIFNRWQRSRANAARDATTSPVIEKPQGSFRVPASTLPSAAR